MITAPPLRGDRYCLSTCRCTHHTGRSKRALVQTRNTAVQSPASKSRLDNLQTLHDENLCGVQVRARCGVRSTPTTRFFSGLFVSRSYVYHLVPRDTALCSPSPSPRWKWCSRTCARPKTRTREWCRTGLESRLKNKTKSRCESNFDSTNPTITSKSSRLLAKTFQNEPNATH